MEPGSDQNSSDFDVRASFVSIVDHLPCEITRQLWFIQDLNQQYDKQHTELYKRLKVLQRHQNKLKNISSKDIPDSYKVEVDKIQALRTRLRRLRIEGLTQSQSLLETIRSAKKQVVAQREQLQHEEKLYKKEIEAKLMAEQKSEGKKLAIPITSTHTRSKRKSPTEALLADLKIDEEPEATRRTRRQKQETTSEQEDKFQMEASKPTIRLKIKPLSLVVPSSKKATDEPTESTKTKDKRNKEKIAKKSDKGKDEKKKKEKEKKQEENVVEEEEEERSSDDEDILYCTCQSPSEGMMVGCDNSNCKIGWFHYSCIGISEDADIGSSWFCQDCAKKRHIKFSPQGYIKKGSKYISLGKE